MLLVAEEVGKDDADGRVGAADHALYPMTSRSFSGL